MHPVIPNTNSLSRGYSLVELVIVMACAAILLSAAVPNLYHLQQEWTLWGSAHLLVTSLQWGRMHAISANTSVTFRVDQNGRRFYWEDPVSGSMYKNTIRHLSNKVQITNSPRHALSFYQHGNAVPAGTFILKGKTGLYRVVVNPGGRIRLQRH